MFTNIVFLLYGPAGILTALFVTLRYIEKVFKSSEKYLILTDMTV
jgi:hypothetical protein